ncbi:hypothetical protein RHOM_03720 [Roseburia hominis A2-183]|uniref:Uncharacterized protein n=1 Tax=Roseburia hominis (strain DSM 16839 / JCM 17582 / NCIMB 14029 / A2-183) TaxID=585394 RepID=G2T071_ROSHA|nr:hypothetical protein [Roseburia hominis]AEN95866.1 hypothetical protein RHOM_03720 [Roseburia hominis A2-183]MDU6920961.1 hypothetical protein [Roseburia hominis]
MIKKKAVAGGIVALAAVLGGGGIFAWTRRTADTETLADNQKYVYAYVTSIEGNELTYMEVDESVVEAYLASSTEDTENTEKGGDGSGAPGGSDGSGAPGGSDTAGAPGDSTEASGDGSGAPGRMSQGTSGTDANTETSDGQPQEENGDMPGDATSDGTGSNGGGAPGGNGGMSGKSVTTLIPVSTVVHTTAGTETTFQRLAAGDLLKLLIETSEDGEEVIIEIWMQ